MTDSLLDLRSSAAGLLALSVKELFPQVLLLGGRSTSLGFYYDFYSPFRIEPRMLKEVEERMFSVIREGVKVSCKEMVPVSAEGYFLSKGESLLAQKMESSKAPYVSFVEIAGRLFFLEAVEGVLPLDRIKGLKIQKAERLGEVTRIHGTAFFDKGELKEFLKKEGDWIGVSHIELGLQRKLFDCLKGDLLWFPAGWKIKESLVRHIQEEAEKEGFDYVSVCPVWEGDFGKKYFDLYEKAHGRIWGKQNKKLVSENIIFYEPGDKEFSSGLLDYPSFQRNFSHLFCREPDLLQEVISCLRFMTKIFRILDLEFHLVLVEAKRKREKIAFLEEALKVDSCEFSREKDSQDARLEWRVKDRLGIEWPVSAVYAPRKAVEDDFWCMPFSLFLSLERVMALMVERSKKKPEDWLKNE